MPRTPAARAWEKRAVMLQPFDMRTPARRRIAEDLLQAGQRQRVAAKPGLGAGKVVAGDGIGGPDLLRFIGPGLGPAAIAQLAQRHRTQRQRAGIVGMNGDLRLHPLQAAARRRQHLLALAQRAIGIDGKTERTEIVGLQVGRPLEQFGGLGERSSRAAIARLEEMRLEGARAQGAPPRSTPHRLPRCARRYRAPGPWRHGPRSVPAPAPARARNWR